MIMDVMAVEFEQLWGPRYWPDADSDFVWDGTAEGYVYIEAEPEQQAIIIIHYCHENDYQNLIALRAST